LAAGDDVRYNSHNKKRAKALGDRMQSSSLVNRLMCVALIVAVVFPLGRMLFPLVGHDIGETPFGAIEAVLSTSLGFGLYAALFG